MFSVFFISLRLDLSCIEQHVECLDFGVIKISFSFQRWMFLAFLWVCACDLKAPAVHLRFSAVLSIIEVVLIELVY